MHLSIIEPPKEELISLADAKEALRIDNIHDDKIVTMLIKSCRQTIETILDKPILEQVFQYEVNCDLTAQNLITTFEDNGRLLKILLPYENITYIPEVTNKSNVICSNGYAIMCKNKSMFLYVDENYVKHYIINGQLDLKIKLVAGEWTNVSQVPETIKFAHMLLLIRAYNQLNNFENFEEIPKSVHQLLSPFKKLM